jgi:flagellar hook assembly protein FlgD
MAANASDITMEARVLGGGVQVIGTPNNYPNPFSPMSGGATKIQYTLSRDATITIIIYDISGHEVKRMKYSSGTSGGKGGTNQASWNGTSLAGEVIGNGMYFYKIISGNQVIGSGKLVIQD